MEENGQVNTNAVVSLTMGILSLLFFPFIGWILGIIGLVYSNRSLREIENTQEKGKNLAVAGKVCSIVGITFSLLLIIIVIGGLALFSFRTIIYGFEIPGTLSQTCLAGHLLL